jgi:hypothetical protein
VTLKLALIGGLHLYPSGGRTVAQERDLADQPATVKQPTVRRVEQNPIIMPEMLAGEDGANICGPSLIRAPAWLLKPLGKYYLYFADHKGSYIRLAYANRLQGPWTIYEPGTLQLKQVVDAIDDPRGKGGHVGSPDVHVDDNLREIRMYFHAKISPPDKWGHKSGIALSQDGIHFDVLTPRPIGEPYFRVFQWDGSYFAVTRSGSLLRSANGLNNFEPVNSRFAEAVGSKATAENARDSEDLASGAIRHTALKLDGNVLSVFFSRSGDRPESILMAQAKLVGPCTNWKLSKAVLVLKPERDYEGAQSILMDSSNADRRKLPRPLFHEVRDPCIFRDGGLTWLLYSVGGERGIAIAELDE